MMAIKVWSRTSVCHAQFLLVATLFPTLACAGTPRFARLGSFEGPVEVQWDAADSWRPGAVNLPLPESTRIRTGPAAKLEIELDDTSAFRMAGEGLAELSDYTKLSGGQRITVISLDRGLAYFTGEPGDGGSIHLLVPGAQLALKQGSRIRLQALDNASEVAIIEGAARLITPSAEMDLHQGQSARVAVPSSTHFSLFREISPLELDGWNEQLDKSEAEAPASRLDLDRAGKWIADGEYGTVWQPASQSGWAPFRQGRWIWYQSAGFVWAAEETWGWKPYHEGRWLQHKNLGWVWVPPADNDSSRIDFSPGAVFWARATNMAAWGPLAPGEQWNGAGPPRQFAALNITGGTFVSGAREILPSPPDEMPKDLLKAFLFTAALPSPPLPVARLAVTREPLRSKVISAVEVVPDVRPVTRAAPPATVEAPVVAEAAPPPPPATPVIAPDPVVSDSPPAPIVPGIIVLTGRDKNRSGGTPGSNSSKKASTPAAPTTTYVAPVSVAWLNGGGPAAPGALYQHWSEQFQQSYKGAQINYNPASGGVRELMRGKLDFAASEMPLTDAQMSDGRTPPLHFPSAVSGVVLVYNVPGIYDVLNLTPELLVRIYLGEIRYWNDPRLVAVNPRASLPPAGIVLVTPSEFSATTHTMTDYLSKVSAAWKAKVGVGANINWPTSGLVGKGDAGVQTMVHQTAFSLGYVDYAWAVKNSLHFAAVRNSDGHFVSASRESLMAAVSSINPIPADLRMSITDAPGGDSYPIASFNYLLIPQRIDDPHKRTALSDFLKWMASEGQKEVTNFEYAPLPPSVVTSERRQLSLIKGQ